MRCAWQSAAQRCRACKRRSARSAARWQVPAAARCILHSPARQLADPASGLQPVHDRHANIHQHQVDAGRAGFAQAKANTAAQAVAAGATDGGANAVLGAYHGSLVPPFCTALVRGYFQQVLASGL